MTDMPQSTHPRRAFWDRFFWKAATTTSDITATADALLGETDLHALAGDDLYATLVTWAAAPLMSELDMQAIHTTLFPRRCHCRRRSSMDCDALDFSGRNVYRLLYYVDECLEQHTDCLFHRTPEIDLLQCRSCGDVWLRGMDQDWLRRHYLLLEPGDLAAIETDRLWPDGLDRFEDSWVAADAGLHRNDVRVLDWQRKANTAEAYGRYGPRV